MLNLKKKNNNFDSLLRIMNILKNSLAVILKESIWLKIALAKYEFSFPVSFALKGKKKKK